jgi:hypothetical protein
MKAPSRRAWWVAIPALVCLLAAPLAVPAAQKKEKKDKEEIEWQPDRVPADALKFGTELEGRAADEFKDWAKGHVTKHMRAAAVNPRAAMQAVDERYPRTSEIARDAGAFLLQYLAYKDEDMNQRMLASRIREIDRKTYDYSRRINEIREGEQRRLMPTTPRGAISAEQRIRLEEEIRQLEEEIRQLGTERQLKATELDASRKKVNLYLKVLGIVHDRMKDVPVESIGELK